MSIPLRYLRHFELLLIGRMRGSYKGVGDSIYNWKCRRCGQLIKPNNAGAQSHIAKHLRGNETKDKR